MMAFIVSAIFTLRYDVSVSTPIYKGEEKAALIGFEQMHLSILNGTLMCAPERANHSQASWELQAV